MATVNIKERPILFRGPMVKALLAGTKTQTRRAVKPQPVGGHIEVMHNDTSFAAYDLETGVGQYAGYGFQDEDTLWRCPYGKVGDRLWVRETFYAWGYWATRFNEKKQRDEKYFDDMTLRVDEKHLFEYPKEFGKLQKGKMGWYKRPSIFMPRAASRLLLQITDVRVERLNSISNQDVIAEGTNCLSEPVYSRYRPGSSKTTYQDCYRSLWEKINGPGAWDANPWVWVVTFKEVQPDAVKEGATC